MSEYWIEFYYTYITYMYSEDRVRRQPFFNLATTYRSEFHSRQKDSDSRHRKAKTRTTPMQLEPQSVKERNRLVYSMLTAADRAELMLEV